ncbi:UbiA family prenyltransferase [Ferruginibacter paludis]|uniref:UbiA family prenyltransferase n=1 Tax=Ferruginibacter paludis TaxID=1310417 RepID=UPI0025B33E95|nr:UbiA family prenyltransferase [Ferruginibacter paludis]MDN3657691.1 UbiA family prenyltransferase [Ferruginibacter paludis]
MRLFYFLINTNIFIALAAVVLTLETQVQLGMRPQFHPYLVLIFFSTLFDYNLHRLITVLTNKEALNSVKHRWVRKNLVLFYILVASSVIGFLWAVFYADIKVLITLAPIALITFFYSVPVYKNKKSLFRLREIPCLKIFLISFVWAATTILLPVMRGSTMYSKEHVLLMMAERFLFVFAITIPFDIRDMKADARQGLKTIPLLIGKTPALILANVLLFLFLVVIVQHYKFTGTNWLIYPLSLSAATTFLFLNNKKLQSNFFYHYGILDGTLLLQGALVLGMFYLRSMF